MWNQIQGILCSVAVLVSEYRPVILDIKEAKASKWEVQDQMYKIGEEGQEMCLSTVTPSMCSITRPVNKTKANPKFTQVLLEFLIEGSKKHVVISKKQFW